MQAQTELDIHFVFYERLLRNFDAELGELLQYLGLQVKPESTQAITQAVEFTTMKAENPHHIRRGRAGEWATNLTSSQKQRARKIAGPLLELLGYPLFESDDPGLSGLPTLPEEGEYSQLAGLIARSRTRSLGESLRTGYRFAMSGRSAKEKLKRLLATLTRR